MILATRQDSRGSRVPQSQSQLHLAGYDAIAQASSSSNRKRKKHRLRQGDKSHKLTRPTAGLELATGSMSQYERICAGTVDEGQDTVTDSLVQLASSPLIALDEQRDILAEMPSFHRKHRRKEALASAAMPSRRSFNPNIKNSADNWELDELLQNQQASNHIDKVQYVDVDLTTPASDKGFVGDTSLDYSTAEQLTSMQELGGGGHQLKHDDDDDSDTDSEDSQPKLLKYAKLILPHVGLVLLTCAYTLIGASIFYSIEGPHELAVKEEELTAIYEQREQFLEQMWHNARNDSIPFGQWRVQGTDQLLDMSDQMFEAFSKHFLTAREVRRNATVEIWTFQTSIFFAVTVVTTIGYGYPVPVTTSGRLICVVFALFGIPLTLVTIADIGKFFSEHLIWSYKKYYICKKSIKKWWQKRKDKKAAKRNKNADGSVVRPEESNDMECCEHTCEHCRECEIDPDLVGIEQRIPATLVLAILLAYTAFGGLLMSELESNWSFLASFYYSFITMTTVGFGDLIPQRDGYLYIILLYIVLGLAITTMCIDLVGVQYIRKIHYFGRKLQDAKSAFAVVGGKVVLVSELYGRLHRRTRDGRLELLFPDGIHPHLVPFIPRDIRRIRWIDREYNQGGDSLSTSTSSMEFHSCKYCHVHRYAGGGSTAHTFTHT